MTLIRTSLLNGIAVGVKMLTLLGINKILAMYVGPSGYAALGQFQNAVQMITTFATGAINNGVIKYTAEYHEDEDKQRIVWRTAGTIALLGSIVTAGVIAALNQPLAAWILRDASFGGVFLWFAATLVLFSANTLLMAVLNGKKEIGRYVSANIAGSVFALLVTAVMAIQLGLYGALVALAVYQSISFFVTLFICRKASWFKARHFVGRVDKKTAFDLAKYTAMALTAAISVPASHMLVRNHLGDALGWEAAGQWDAVWRLSSAYLLLVTTTLSVYYLPRLSELTGHEALRREIGRGYKVILPIAALGGLLMYLFRDLIIEVLFTRDFISMRDLFAWQMLGDTLKIGSWVLAYLVLGKAMLKTFVGSEVVFAGAFVILTYYFTEKLGFEGVAVAHAVNYAAYWLFLGWATRPLLRG